MTMTIGRATINDDPAGGTFRARGDEVSFRFDLAASSVAQYQALMQQLRGMDGNDDSSTWPFTWSEDATFDGYYTDVRVEIEPAEVALTTGSAQASLRMRRVSGGFAQPRIEVTTTMATRTNSHAIASPVPLLLFSPATGSQFDFDPSEYTAGTQAVLDVDDGSTLIAYETTYASSVGTKAHRFGTPPAAHYSGAATIEADFGGTFYALEGAHAPVRAYPVYNAGNGNTDLQVESWNGSAWAGTAFSPSDASVAAGGPPLFGVAGLVAAARIVRNSAVQCVLRFDLGALTTYLSVARGQPFITATVIETAATPTYQMGWEPTAPGSPASTSITGGARASSASAGKA